MKRVPIAIISHPIGFRGFLEASSVPTVAYPMTMARASRMKTGSLAKLLLSVLRVIVAPTRRMAATHTASGARARIVEVMGSWVLPPAMLGFCGLRTSAVQGGTTIQVGANHPPE